MDWHLIIFNKFHPLTDYFILPFKGTNIIELDSLLDLIVIGGKCLYAGPYVCFLLEDEQNNIYRLRGPMCFRGQQYVCLDLIKNPDGQSTQGCLDIRLKKTITFNSRHYALATEQQRGLK